MITTLLSGLAVTPELMQAFVPDVYMSYRLRTSKPLIRPLVIKSHLPYQPLVAKVIYVVRDGRTVLESYYRFVQQLPASIVFRGFTSPQDFYFRTDLWPSPWHEHIDGWLDGFDGWKEGRYLILRYEDLVRSTARCLRSAAEFIGLDPSESDLRRAVKLNTKQRMSETESLAGAGSLGFVRTSEHKIDDVLSEEEIRRFEEIAGGALRRLGYQVV